MTYTDKYVLESDLDGITKHDFEVVMLTGMDGNVGALVLNQYGMGADMEQLAQKVQRRFSRLLVGVEDANDAMAVERVRSALSWPNYPPF